MDAARRQDLKTDLVGELETLMKIDDPDKATEAHLPLLAMSADEWAAADEANETGVAEFLGAVLRGIEDGPSRRALRHLFAGESRWSPLATRGELAGEELGITYDALRRRNKHGVRRLDQLLGILAEAVLDLSPLHELIGNAASPWAAPDPGVDTWDRASVFFSYARSDDDHEGGLIAKLRDRLIAEFRFQTGRELYIFHDRSAIDPGENWKRKIQEKLDATNFLLVLLTPSYLGSQMCRAELTRFIEREHAMGRDDLIMPIYYSAVHDSTDALLEALLSHQYIDWQELRFLPWESPDVRRAVAELATAIAVGMERHRSAVAGSPSTVPEPAEEDGVLERLVEMELAMPRLVRNLVALGAEQEGVTEEVRSATAEINAGERRGRGSVAKLLVTKRLASTLEPYADRMERIAGAIRGDLAGIDIGVHALAGQIPESEEEGIEDTVEQMVSSLDGAREASVGASSAIDTMATAYMRTGRLSSSMRPTLARLASAAGVVHECPPQFETWVKILREALEARRDLQGPSTSRTGDRD